MVQSEDCNFPKEPGWYSARMKSWPIHEGYALVKVTQVGSADPLQVWQCGDGRPWSVDAWDWRSRVWP